MAAIMLTLLRTAYAALLAAEVVWIAPTALRALTNRTQGKDMLFMLFWGLAFNRLWFFAHAIRFNDRPDAGADIALLTASYLFAVTLEALVLVAYYWERHRAP